MKCPVCYNEETKVLDSRATNEDLSIRRRRECLKCSFRFSTYEEMEILDLTVLKKDGDRESYSRDKIMRGLHRALEKRSVTDDDFKKLINLIERDLQSLRRNEVSSDEVGKVVLDHLQDFDQVAY
ncbi:MAG TPA: transcriptional regulator NrdR, partial [bacterium]|nr:transcriptional regulator NrdR [bacterium]